MRVLCFVFAAAVSVAPVGSRWFWVLCLPLEWAGHLYSRAFPAEIEKDFGEVRVQVYLVNVTADFLLSSVLTYSFLWFRARRQRPPTQQTSSLAVEVDHILGLL
jgi:hypothetical protein